MSADRGAKTAAGFGIMCDMVDVCELTKFAASGKKSGKKGGKKTEDRVLALLARNPKLTFAGMVAALGISRSAIQKHIARLKDAQRLRRIGPDKGGHWEVA